MEVTVDSSVLVSALLPHDQHSPKGRAVLARHFNGEYVNVTSITVPIEVTCAIARRAGEAKARIARSQLSRWEELELMQFEPLTAERAEDALKEGMKLRLKGMDAVVVAIAREAGRPLITFDEEMAKRAAREVKVLTSKDFRVK